MVKAPHITPILTSPHWVKINERIGYQHLSLTYKILISYLLFSLHVKPDLHLLSPYMYIVDRLYLPHYKSPTAVLDMHHLTCGISSLLYSVNLIVSTLLLTHLILRISPHHSHHLRSHHLSLPRPFTPD